MAGRLVEPGMRRTLLPLMAIAVLLGSGACADQTDTGTAAPSGPTTPTETIPTGALALCQRALPDRDVVSGTWTTVGDLRTWGYGGPVQKRPLATAFPGAAADARAAWCWTRQAADDYTAWGVPAPDGTPVQAIDLMGPMNTNPSGPPVIP
jgi:hypothetical protein